MQFPVLAVALGNWITANWQNRAAQCTTSKLLLKLLNQHDAHYGIAYARMCQRCNQLKCKRNGAFPDPTQVTLIALIGSRVRAFRYSKTTASSKTRQRSSLDIFSSCGAVLLFQYIVAIASIIIWNAIDRHKLLKSEVQWFGNTCSLQGSLSL